MNDYQKPILNVYGNNLFYGSGYMWSYNICVGQDFKHFLYHLFIEWVSIKLKSKNYMQLPSSSELIMDY